MDLKLREVSRLLHVEEQTIQEMVRNGNIPSYEMNGQLRFSRNEIEAWVMARDEQTRAAAGGQTGFNQFNLYRAINHGGVAINVGGDSKEEVIRSSMAELATRLELDGSVLTDLVLDREQLMPTGLGEGIAVPHARDFLLSTPFDVVNVVFPARPLDYQALDGKPVYVLFFLFACQDQRHLNLLAKIAHLAKSPDARKVLMTRPPQSSLLNFIKEWEGGLRSHAGVH